MKSALIGKKFHQQIWIDVASADDRTNFLFPDVESIRHHRRRGNGSSRLDENFHPVKKKFHHRKYVIILYRDNIINMLLNNFEVELTYRQRPHAVGYSVHRLDLYDLFCPKR